MQFAIRTKEYPYNILSDIFMTEDVGDYTNEENLKELESVISSFDKLTYACLVERYQKHDTFYSIAARHGLNTSRVRTIIEKALFKIRTTEKALFIKLGRKKYVEDCKAEKFAYKDNTPLDSLELSLRSLNSLKRAGYRYIYEIINFTINDLLIIKNVGKHNAQEIINAIKTYRKFNLVPTKAC